MRQRRPPSLVSKCLVQTLEHPPLWPSRSPGSGASRDVCLPVPWTNARASEQVLWSQRRLAGPLIMHTAEIPCLRFLWKLCLKNHSSIWPKRRGRTNKYGASILFYPVFLAFQKWRKQEGRAEAILDAASTLKIRLFKEQPYWEEINKGKTLPDELNESGMLLWNQQRFHCLPWIAHIFVFTADNEFLWHSGIHYRGGKKTQPALFVPFSAFRHNGNVNMLNIHGLSYSLASLFIVIMSLGEGRPYFHTRGAAC